MDRTLLSAMYKQYTKPVYCTTVHKTSLLCTQVDTKLVYWLIMMERTVLRNIHGRNIPNGKAVQSMCKMCANCVLTVCKLCANCVQTVCKLCANCVQTVCKLCANCVQTVYKLCANCVQTVCKLWASCVQTVCKLVGISLNKL